jgi:SSS family solute:Na+ symporter
MTVQLVLSLSGVTLGGVLGFVFKNSLYAGVCAMLGGLIIVPLVSLLTQKRKPQNTDEIFKCYDTVISVPASSSLEEK